MTRLATNLAEFLLAMGGIRYIEKQRRIKRQRKVFPHSSTRQQARYKRQIEAGQLSMKGIDEEQRKHNKYYNQLNRFIYE